MGSNTLLYAVQLTSTKSLTSNLGLTALGNTLRGNETAEVTAELTRQINSSSR
jgi:hypothetical protein